MFSGIVSALGIVENIDGGRYTLRWPNSADLISIGDSISVNGTCLTAVCTEADSFEVDVVPETLSRTNLASLVVGDFVNLERPVSMGGTLDGHIVQGHVDVVGKVLSPAPNLVISPDDATLLRYVVEKGSITVDGISLTVVAVGGDHFSVAVIPHTQAVTTLGFRCEGDSVNLEFDVIAKYVERLLAYKG